MPGQEDPHLHHGGAGAVELGLGAAGGGAVFDLHGASGVFTGSGLLLLGAMVIVFAAVRVKPVARADQPVTGRLSREIDN